MSSVGFSPSQSVLLLAKQSGGFDKLQCTLKDFKNMRRDAREDIKEYDAELLIEHFKMMKLRNEKFFYAYQVDQDSRLSHCIWADATSIQDYDFFGDVVTFDTTFKIN